MTKKKQVKSSKKNGKVTKYGKLNQITLSTKSKSGDGVYACGVKGSAF